MASLHSTAPQSFLPITKPIIKSKHRSTVKLKGLSYRLLKSTLLRPNRRNWVVCAVAEELEKDGGAVGIERGGGVEIGNQIVGGFANEGRLSFEGAAEFSATATPSSSASSPDGELGVEKWVDRAINATIVLAAGSFAITKLLTIDQDYWHVSAIFDFILLILMRIICERWSYYELEVFVTLFL